MKNTLLLDLKPSKSCNIDLPSSNDFFDLAVADKMEDGELNDVTNELREVLERVFFDATGYADDEEEEEEVEEEEVYVDSGEEIQLEIWKRLKTDVKAEFKRLEINRPEMDFLYAGYVDCMDEAVRYLIEEENISPEHPVLINLKAHLEKSKEKILSSSTNSKNNGLYSQNSIFYENFQNRRDSG